MGEILALVANTDITVDAGTAVGGVSLTALAWLAWQVLRKLDAWLDAEKETRGEERTHRASEARHWDREERLLADALGQPRPVTEPHTPVQGISVGQQ